MKGYLKKCTLLIVLLGFSISSFTQLNINEISARKGVIDEDSDNVDWFEVYNSGSETIDLSNYTFTDDPEEIDKWILPTVNIDPGEYILILASSKDRIESFDHWESVVFNYNLWAYFLGSTNPAPSWYLPSYDDSAWSQSVGGIGYGDGDDNLELESPVQSIYMRTSFNIVDIDNIDKIILHADYDDGFIAYMNGEEFARSGNVIGDFPDYDVSVTEIHEANLYLGEQPEKFALYPEDFTGVLLEGENVLSIHVVNESLGSSDITSNFYLSLGISNDSYDYNDVPYFFEEAPSYLHTNFKLSGGETLGIYDSNGVLADQKLIDGDLPYGVSMGRNPDGIGEWCLFNTPTPNESNNSSICFSGIEPQPILSLESGYYEGSQTVSINSFSENPAIRYTLNGDEPTINSMIYEGPLEINENTVLSVKVFSSENALPSQVLDRTFFIDDENHNLPVFSIITDSLNLWGWETGIYVDGPNADLDNYPYYGANFWEPWSKWSRLEYFDRDQVKQAEETFDLEIHGGWSRAEPQKSFRLDFKSIYSGDLEFPIIPDKPYVTSYNNFNLRNGGQHFGSDKMQDAFIGRMMRDTHVDYMGYEPALVYLNGEYWGVYGIREKIDESFVESNHLVDKDEVNLLNSWNTLHGSGDHFFESYDVLMNIDVDDPSFYNEFDNRFDVLNYTDYFIVETYGGNLDWMGIAWGLNNTKLWRPESENGKWRYVLYDTDACFGGFGNDPWDNFIDYARNPSSPSEHSDIFDKVLENTEYKHLFVNRYADLMNTVFQPDNFENTFYGMKQDLENAMPEHIDTWGVPNDMGDWAYFIDNILNYNSQRLDWSRFIINQEFELNGEVDVDLDVLPLSNSGRIQISTIIPEQYPWSGVYFDGCPVQITAIPNSGYVFDHWEPNVFWDENNNNQQITVNIDEAASFVAVFVGEAEVPVLQISEINYNSHPSIDAGDWIEIHNTSDIAVDITDYEFGDSNEQMSFDIPLNTVIPPNGYLVLVNSTEQFQTIHPMVTNFIGDINFSLSNTGEFIFLKNHLGEEVLTMEYNNNNPWPQGANGNGRTLELSNANDYNNPESWFDGCMLGSPGVAYSLCSPDIVFSEINYNSLSSIDSDDWVEIKNVGVANIDLTGWKFSDGNSDNVFVIQSIDLEPEAYLVINRNDELFDSVYQCHNIGNLQGPFIYGLSADEENLLLFDDQDKLVYSMHYKGDEPWPTGANGEGLTLELDDLSQSPNDPNNWFVGCPQGSPTQAYEAACSQSLSVSVEENDGVLLATTTGGTPTYTYQWILDEEIVGNSNEITMNENGIYVAVVIDENDCTASSQPYEITNVGVTDYISSELKIFPNPARNKFVISGLVGESRIAIHSIEGKLVRDLGLIKDNYIVVNSELWSEGVYFITVENGSEIMIKKIAKN